MTKNLDFSDESEKLQASTEVKEEDKKKKDPKPLPSDYIVKAEDSKVVAE